MAYRLRVVLAALPLLACLVSTAPAAAIRGEFIGNDTCYDCHKAVFDSWKDSRHAKVYELLKPGVRPKEKQEAGLKPKLDYTQDKSCMECHVTGYDQGGFDFASPDRAWEGIGCEECHGPAKNWILIHDKTGLQHMERKLKQAGHIEPFKGKTVCLRCHGHRNSPYRYRSEKEHFGRDWTSPEWTKTYHVLPEPKGK